MTRPMRSVKSRMKCEKKGRKAASRRRLLLGLLGLCGLPGFLGFFGFLGYLGRQR